MRSDSKAQACEYKNLCLDVFFLPFRFQWIESKRSRIFFAFLRGRSGGMRFFDVRRLGECVSMPCKKV